MECEDTPDIGANSGAAGYLWDDLKLYNKQITVTCPVGKISTTTLCTWMSSWKLQEKLLTQSITGQLLISVVSMTQAVQ